MSLTDDYFEMLKDKYLKNYEKKALFAYKKVSSYLKDIEEEYKENASANKDKGQGWRSIKGRLFERFVKFILEKEDSELGLGIGFSSDREIEKLKPGSKLFAIKEQIQVSYGDYDALTPDADIVIYLKKNLRVLAIISCKVTLRERIAQTGYWKLKLEQRHNHFDVKYFLVTLDQDGDFEKSLNIKRNRIIAEADTDGVFVVSENFQPAGNVYDFTYLIARLQELAEAGRN